MRLLFAALGLLALPALVQPAAPTLPNPVLPGDFPDPSVVKIGDTYWATATSSDWGPIFPLLQSRNLQDWTLTGYVFPTQRPAWADHYFWAPEISQANGKIYVYYAAHQAGGNLAVGVASAEQPEGPYTDHGPLVGQPDGSIDAFPVPDEQGQPYLVWKEDGNSIGQPTPIWAQPLSSDRTRLVGEKQELFRNERGSWEGGLVEGVSLVRHGGYYYVYAANGCCGSGCTYATGVARARHLLGPWEKNPRNPVFTNIADWRCPGHGTAVEYRSRWYLLHHAYPTQGAQHIGCEGVLSEFRWSAQGWPEVMSHGVPGPATPPAATRKADVADSFGGPSLALGWQWPVQARPIYAVQGGVLQLTAQATGNGAVLARSVAAPAYVASVTLLAPAALPAGTEAGLAAVGSPDNSLALTVGDGQLHLWQRRQGQRQLLATAPLPAGSGPLHLRLRVSGATHYRFDYSPDQGRSWQQLPGAGAAPLDGAYLPPWDLGVLAQGVPAAPVAFDDFSLRHE